MTPTNNPMPTIRSDVDQQRANEQLRQAILDKKQAQIEAWSAQIEQLQQSMQSVAENLRDETEKRRSAYRTAMAVDPRRLKLFAPFDEDAEPLP